VSDGEMKVVDHEGDNFLGGSDFDRLIIEKIVIPYLEENHGLDDLKLNSHNFFKKSYAKISEKKEKH
jgi:molecular chaperone DnaK